MVALVAFLIGAGLTFVGIWILNPGTPVVPAPTRVKALENWHVGDVHTHAVGDAPLIDHPACARPRGEALPEQACAAQVVRLMLRAATANGLEWLILSEHGPWLGVRGLTHIGHYDPEQGRTEWDEIRAAAEEESVAFGIRALMGEELGSAPPFSSSGHFNAYQIDEYVPNDTAAVPDASYIQDVAEAGGWGGINHPFLGANAWDCWFPTSTWVSNLLGLQRKVCTIGASDFAPNPFLDATSREALAAMEILNGSALPLPGVLPQWDQLLQQGYRVWAVGGSDAHVLSRGFDSWKHGVDGQLGGQVHVGSSKTFVYVPTGQYAEPVDGYDSTDPADPIRNGIRLGRTVASNGGFAMAQIANTLPGSSVSVPEGEVNVEVSVVWQRDFTTDGDPPSSIRVVSSQYGPRCMEQPCEIAATTGCVTRPCVAGTEPLDVTSLDSDHDQAVVSVVLPEDWARAYLRVEVLGGSNEGSPTTGAYVSPIFLER